MPGTQPWGLMEVAGSPLDIRLFAPDLGACWGDPACQWVEGCGPGDGSSGGPMYWVPGVSSAPAAFSSVKLRE